MAKKGIVTQSQPKGVLPLRNIANGALGETPEKMVHSEEVQERRKTLYLSPTWQIQLREVAKG